MLRGIAKRKGMGFTTVFPTAVSLAVMMTFLWSFYSPGQVHACTCVRPGSPTEELEEADAVFTGRVISVHRPDDRSARSPTSTGFTSNTVGFEVSTVWKGTVHEKMYITTASLSMTCGFNFKRRKEYIVYAYGNPDNERGYGTGWCSRTALFRQARGDLDALGGGHVPIAGTGGPVPEQTPSLFVSRAWVIALSVVAVVIAIGVVVVYPRFRRGRTAF